MPVIVRAAPGAHSDEETLDIPEPQILLGFPEDHFEFHVRILLIMISAGRWMVCTLTWDVQVQDLSDEDVTPLERASRFPRRGRPFFAFSPPSEANLRQMRARALSLAAVMGLAAPSLPAAAVDAQWYFADAAVIEFATPVPASILGAAGAVLRTDAGMVPINSGQGEKFTFVVMSTQDLDGWIAEKRHGAGRG